jgi:hypothetical protein
MKIDFLSPSLFSLHNEGRGLEKLTSLPTLIQGFSQRDQQLWMDFIVEAAGVLDRTEALEKVAKENIYELYKLNFVILKIILLFEN